ncbi:YhjD/YihY/BrkB family envelope integrity protein [Kitasatospora sp. NPDC050543]|uniref:YhjD/YihY/BrkB family envelope integrity protein n=1 Tax=Kitasatospora sp. NPDC050543 TaxID=3364054 RepID=UPI0037B31DAC
MTRRRAGPQPGGVSGPARLKARAAAGSAYAKALPEHLPVVGRAIGQLLRVNLLDCATRLAAQAFLSALPALLVVGVFAPAAVRSGVTTTLREQLGLQGPAQQAAQQMLSAGHGGDAESFGVLGVVLTLLSATALSRAMQRVCERCWELPRAGTRLAAWRWLAWLLVWLAYLTLLSPVRDGFGLGDWLGIPLSFVSATALWWWTQHLLLGSRVHWLPLLPGALLCGVAMVGVSIASRVYLPGAMSRSVSKFGPYGVVFTSLSWLIVMFTTVTLAIALGRVIAEEEAVAHRLGQPARQGPGPGPGPGAGGAGAKAGSTEAEAEGTGAGGADRDPGADAGPAAKD